MTSAAFQTDRCFYCFSVNVVSVNCNSPSVRVQCLDCDAMFHSYFGWMESGGTEMPGGGRIESSQEERGR